MKAAFSLLATVILTMAAGAVEYVTLITDDSNEPATFDGQDFVPSNPLTVPSNSIVEIVGHSQVSGVLVGTPSDETIGFLEPDSQTGQVFTGFTTYRAVTTTDNANAAFVTLKITSAAEINAVTPSAVLVLPEDSTGNFDIIIETSDDLVSWAPFFSQTVNSQTAQRFFRTRVTKTPAP